MNKAALHFCTLCTVILGITSCQTQKYLLTEQTGPVADLLAVDSTYTHIIQPDDKISMSIWNHPDYSLGSAYTVHNTNESYGKWILVDDEGNVPLPKIGKVSLCGLTSQEAIQLLEARYGTFLVDPIITVKVLNRNITVMGEVRTPGNFLLDKERTTVSEALGMAQGFTNYSNTKKIRLIRDGVSYTLNLKSFHKSLLQNIILKSGDLLIIPEKRGKSFELKSPILISISSAVTAFVLVYSILQTNN